MKEFLDKLSSYNFFNYLFPGTLTCLVLKQLTMYNLVRDNIVEAIFVYYFCGLVISRIGSLVIEPILKKSKLVDFAEYMKFVEASKIDAKLELLSEVNNMYRTIISAIFIVVLSLIIEKCQMFFGFSENNTLAIVVVILFMIFIASYKKQTGYVKKRVAAVLKEKNE